MKLKVFALLLLIVPGLSAQSYTISTFAGRTLPVLPAPALSSSVGYVEGLAIDGSGNLYVSDQTLNVVLKVSAAGVTTVFAGTGQHGFSRDGGPATSAQLNGPSTLAFDANGNLLVADSGNQRIRAVSPGGTLSTFAGSGNYGYSGDGGLASAATFAYPEGLAVGANGDVYVADSNNYVVRVISSAGTISTFAGNNIQGYSGGGGPATGASVGYIYSLAADATGTYISPMGTTRWSARSRSGGG